MVTPEPTPDSKKESSDSSGSNSGSEMEVDEKEPDEYIFQFGRKLKLSILKLKPTNLFSFCRPTRPNCPYLSEFH